MDIKGIVRNVLPFNVDRVKEREKTTMDSTQEREGNGQAQGEEQKRKRNLSPEELQEAVKFLEDLPGVKDNHLQVKLVQKDGATAVFIEDRDGKVVRRIPESELSTLSKNKTQRSGHLLNKAL